jgi:hypothetical protein
MTIFYRGKPVEKTKPLVRVALETYVQAVVHLDASRFMFMDAIPDENPYKDAIQIHDSEGIRRIVGPFINDSGICKEAGVTWSPLSPQARR